MLTTTGLLTANGGLINSFYVQLVLYGTPTCWTSPGSSVTSPFTTANTYYVTFASNSNHNWTPSYSGSYKLAIPYTGIYALEFTMSSDYSTGATLQLFISKNLGNGADTYSGGNVVFCQNFGTTNFGGGAVGCSGTAFLQTSDYICLGFFLNGGTMTTNTRSNAILTLLQRTA